MEKYAKNTARWVVGECFGQAAENAEVITPGHLLDLLASGSGTPGSLDLSPGLGIDSITWDHLRDTVSTGGLADRIRFHGEPPRPVPRHTVVKKGQDNVLIGDARVLGDNSDNTAAANLLVPNHTELILDHTAERQHVPGLLLIDAAVQLVTWATTELFPPGNGGPPRYAVIRGCGFSFERFVFPLPTELSVRLSQSGPTRADRVPLTADVEIHQNGQLTTRGHFEFNAFDPASIFAIERDQVRRQLAETAEGVVHA